MALLSPWSPTLRGLVVAGLDVWLDYLIFAGEIVSANGSAG